MSLVRMRVRDGAGSSFSEGVVDRDVAVRVH